MAPHAVAMTHGAVFHFAPQRMMLVERYLPGREASVECLVTGGRIHPLWCTTSSTWRSGPAWCWSTC